MATVGPRIVNWVENHWYTHHPPPVGGRPPVGAIRQPSAATASNTVGLPHLPTPPAIAPPAVAAPAGRGAVVAGRAIGRRHPRRLRDHAAARRRPHELRGRGGLDGHQAARQPRCTRGARSPAAAPTCTRHRSLPPRPTAWSPPSTPGSSCRPPTAATTPTAGSSFRCAPAPPPSSSTATARRRWGSGGVDVSMTPDVVSVRQNLDLLVDHGQPVPGLNAPTRRKWGATLGDAVYVWRSGLGVTADGALVYVGGPGSTSPTWPTCWSGPARCGRWSSTSTPTG